MKKTSKQFSSAHRVLLLVSAGILTLGLAASSLAAQAVSGQAALAPILTVFAGGGGTVPGAVAEPAASAQLSGPAALVVDGSGNIYIADAVNNLVEEVSSGQITVFAGGGATVPSTSAIAATSALLNHPTGLAVDSSGDIYIADQGNNLIEEVAGGQISVVAGGGNTVPTTSYATATTVQLKNPTSVAVDSSGTIYIADTGNNFVELINPSNNGLKIRAGGGGTVATTSAISGTSAKLSAPSGVAVTGDRYNDYDEHIYIVDTGNNQVEVVDDSGNISLLAGGGSTIPGTTPIAATNAQLSAPTGISIDGSNFIVTDTGNNLIEEISSGEISAVAGGGSTVPSGSVSIAPLSAKFVSPAGTAVDASGNLYIADTGNNLVEVAGESPVNLPTTSIGSTSTPLSIQIVIQPATTNLGITASKAPNGAQEFAIGTITGCVVGSANAAASVCVVPVTFSPAYPGLRTATLTIADGSNMVGTVGVHGIGLGAQAALWPGQLQVIAGGGQTDPGATAIAATTARMLTPTGVAMDSAGNLYVAVGNGGFGAIEKITPAGGVTLLAGGPNGTTFPSTTPMAPTSAEIYPFGVAVDGAGNVYIGDNGPGGGQQGSGGGAIEEIDATTGQLVLLAGGQSNSAPQPSTSPQSATSVWIEPFGIAVDQAGNLFIADCCMGGGAIEEVPVGSGGIQVVAGGDWTFVQVLDVAVDTSENIYVADVGDDLIWEVTAGQATPIAGFGPNLPTIVPGIARDAALNTTSGIAVDAAGNVYIADTSNGLVEQVSPAGMIVVVAGSGTAAPGIAAAPAPNIVLSNPTGVMVDGAGNLYITDTSNNLVEKVTTAATTSLAFPSTYVGATSPAQWWATLGNIGNQTLNLTAVSSVTDFPLEDGSTCSTLGAQTVLQGASCTLLFGFEPTVAASLDETVTLTDNTLNTTNAKQTISLTGTGVVAVDATYSLTVNPSSLTIQAGSSGSADFTLTPTGGYTGSITLSCLGMPAYATCSFAQNPVTLSGNNQPVGVTLTIDTNVAETAAISGAKKHASSSMLPALAFLWPGGLLGLVAIRRRNRKIRLRMSMLVLMLGTMAATLSGCNSSQSTATPASTSTVTVISTAQNGASGVSQSANLVLTITQ